MVKKNFPAIHILIPVRIRIKLEKIAFENSVTMSWIVRAIIHQWRLNYHSMPVFKRPAKLSENHTDFSLKLYGNKEEILVYSRCNGGEFSPFIRHLLELWDKGDLTINLESVVTVKNIKNMKIEFNGVATVKQKSVVWYKKSEFWIKNPIRNLFLMSTGLSCRIHPLNS